MQNHPLCSVVLFLDRRSRLVGSACEGVRRMNKARNLLRREAKASVEEYRDSRNRDRLAGLDYSDLSRMSVVIALYSGSFPWPPAGARA
jgi:hypothetical protein